MIESATQQNDPVVRFPLDIPVDVSDAALVRLCDESGRPWMDWHPRSEPPVSLQQSDRLILQVAEHQPDCTATILNASQPETFEGVWIGEGAVSRHDIAAIADHRARDVCLGPWWWDEPLGHTAAGIRLPANPEVFAPLRHLQRFEVHRAPFGNDHLRALGSHGRIRSLAFTQTDVTGAGVAAGLFSNLTDLRFAEDTAVSEDLTFLNRLPNLHHLALRGAGLTDERLTDLRPCPMIKWLDLANNPLGRTSLAALAALPQLRTLKLTDTDTNDDTVGSLENVRSLYDLWLARTPLTDAAVPNLGRLRSVKRLWLPYTRITDQGLGALVRAMPQLWRLDVSMTRVTSDSVQHLRHLKNLFRLDISPQALTDDLVEMFGGMPEMGEVGLRGPGDSDAIWELMATIADTIGGAQYMGRA